MNTKLRPVVIAGNWKMNKTRDEAHVFIKELQNILNHPLCDIVLCAPFTNLETLVNDTKESDILIGAQNCHFESKGAYTGEISADMLVDLNVSHVIIGHSERRQYFGETDQTVNLRLKSALSRNLTGILCVGETLQQREMEITEQVIAMQTKIALHDVDKDSMKNVIIAYEPVWAIGTGKTATAEQAAKVCGFIRKIVEELYDKSTAQSLIIQYGGSMNPNNAEELLSKEDIDGGLIGGASLKPKDFAALIEIATKLYKSSSC